LPLLAGSPSDLAFVDCIIFRSSSKNEKGENPIRHPSHGIFCVMLYSYNADGTVSEREREGGGRKGEDGSISNKYENVPSCKHGISCFGRILYN